VAEGRRLVHSGFAERGAVGVRLLTILPVRSDKEGVGFGAKGDVLGREGAGWDQSRGWRYVFFSLYSLCERVIALEATRSGRLTGHETAQHTRH